MEDAKTYTFLVFTFDFPVVWWVFVEYRSEIREESPASQTTRAWEYRA
jgi:hypothetical protein